MFNSIWFISQFIFHFIFEYPVTVSDQFCFVGWTWLGWLVCHALYKNPQSIIERFLPIFWPACDAPSLYPACKPIWASLPLAIFFFWKKIFFLILFLRIPANPNHICSIRWIYWNQKLKTKNQNFLLLTFPLCYTL